MTPNIFEGVPDFEREATPRAGDGEVVACLRGRRGARVFWRNDGLPIPPDAAAPSKADQ
jgi:hypothetical protein